MQTYKNSLLQLYRFIFALFIMFYHDLFAIEHLTLFSHANYSVEFFFLLSGCFLFQSFKRYINLSIKNSCLLLIKNILSKLGIPLAVGYIFSVIRTIFSKTIMGGIMHYLWFVHVLIITELLFLVLSKLIKKEKILLIVIALISLTSAILRVHSFFYTWGFLRAFAYVGLGIFISKIPLLKKTTFTTILFIAISLISFVLIFTVFYLPENHIIEFGFDVVVLPALIYSALNLSFNNKLFNYLGSIAFGIYAFQPLGWAYWQLGNSNHAIIFLMIVFLAIITNELTKIVKERKYL